MVNEDSIELLDICDTYTDKYLVYEACEDCKNTIPHIHHYLTKLHNKYTLDTFQCVSIFEFNGNDESIFLMNKKKATGD